MRAFSCSLVAISVGLAMSAAPAAAQKTGSVVADLVKDVSEVEEKLVGLAKAIPADKYGWRPGQGVRSIGEVVMHVASDNWFIPGATGTAIPAATGIKPDDYKTVVAYEGRSVTPDAAVQELQSSFAYLKKAMRDTPEASMSVTKKVFGQDFTMQQVWIMATTHLHEHLGQLIAYARSNGVVPPWSK
ncbi:MAG: DinB family protein [Gemmatimonadaceae bacterium]